MGDANWKRLGKGDLLTQDADVGLGHVVEHKTYLKIFLALLFLTVLTVAVAFIDMEPFNFIVKIGIATLKAGLVMSYFMHLRWDKPLVIAVALYPLVIVALLFLGTLGDFSIKDYPQPSLVTPAVSE